VRDLSVIKARVTFGLPDYLFTEYGRFAQYTLQRNMIGRFGITSY